jgi:hypothetical protein
MKRDKSKEVYLDSYEEQFLKEEIEREINECNLDEETADEYDVDQRKENLFRYVIRQVKSKNKKDRFKKAYLELLFKISTGKIQLSDHVKNNGDILDWMTTELGFNESERKALSFIKGRTTMELKSQKHRGSWSSTESWDNPNLVWGQLPTSASFQ